MNSAINATLAFTICIILSACAHIPLPDSTRSAVRQMPEGISGAILDRTDSETKVTAVREYIIGPGDVYEIVLRGSGAKLAVVTVQANGRADLPFGGNRHVAGETAAQLEKFLSFKREKETNDPTAVEVHFLNINNVYLLGEVKRAGAVPYKPGLTLGEALKNSGGATHRAEARQVWIKPRHGDKELAAPFDPSLPLLPGDMVRLRERYF